MASLPDWLDPLPDAGEQRALDEWAIGERGIPGLELMERAGTGLADLVGELAPTGRIVAVCGKGNNGGDGLVAARLLRDRGREVDVLLLGDPGELRGDARTNLERLPGGGAGAVRRARRWPAPARSSTRSSGRASRGSRVSPRPARSWRSTTPAGRRCGRGRLRRSERSRRVDRRGRRAWPCGRAPPPPSTPPSPVCGSTPARRMPARSG